MQSPGPREPQVPIEIRPARQEDANLVLSSWLKSNHDSTFATNVSTERYYNEHKRLVLALLSRCNVTVASDPNDSDQIYGWIAWEVLEGDILCVAYAYTKYPWRQLGVMRALWRAINPTNEETLVLHTGRSFQELRKRGYPLTYCPYTLFRLTERR